MWNDKQIVILQDFLIQETPKIVENYVDQDLNEKSIEAISRDILKHVRKTFDPRIELQTLYEETTREFSIYLRDEDKTYELLKGTL